MSLRFVPRLTSDWLGPTSQIAGAITARKHLVLLRGVSSSAGEARVSLDSPTALSSLETFM